MHIKMSQTENKVSESFTPIDVAHKINALSNAIAEVIEGALRGLTLTNLGGRRKTPPELD